MGTTASFGLSFNIDQDRNVSSAFEQMIKMRPTLLSLIGIGQPATQTKDEWAQDSIAPTSTTITAINVNVFTLASATGIEVGSILRFASSADVTRTEQVKVTAVNGNDVTCARNYGGTSTGTLAVSDKVFLVSKPIGEATDASAKNASNPDLDYNFTEIFEDGAQVSLTTAKVKHLSLSDALTYEESNALSRIAYRVNSAIMHGRRVQRTQSENGSMGGFLQFMEGGQIDTTGGAISKAILNNMLEAVFNQGGYSNNYAIVCNTNQARRISAFNTSGNNPVVTQADKTTGGYVQQFIGDLPVMGGFTANVVVDPTFAKDQIALLDLNKIELAFLRDPTFKDATLPGGDYLRTRFIQEVTLRVKDGTRAHALAKGLTV